MFSIFSKNPRVVLTDTTAWTTGYTGVGIVGNTVLPKTIAMYRTPVSGAGTMYGEVYTNGKPSGSINFGSSFNSSSPAPQVANDASGNFWSLNWYAYNQSSSSAYGSPNFKRESGAAALATSSVTNAGNLVDFSDFLLINDDAMWVSKHNIAGSSDKYTYWYYYNSSTNTWSTGTWSTNTALIPKAVSYQNSTFVIFYTNTASPTVLRESQYNAGTNTWSAGSVLSTSSVFSGTWISKSYQDLNVNNKSYHLIVVAPRTLYLVATNIAFAESTTTGLGDYYSTTESAVISTYGLNNVPGFQLCWRNYNTGNYYFYCSTVGGIFEDTGNLSSWGLNIPNMPIKISKLSNGTLFVDNITYRPYIRRAEANGALLGLKKADAITWSSTFASRYNWVSCGKTTAWLSGVPNDQNANSTVYFNRR